MKLKGLHFADVAEIQEAVTDELKKVEEAEFSAAFQEMHNRPKACIYIYMLMDFVLNIKNEGLCLSFVSSIFRKSVLKLLDLISCVRSEVTCSGHLQQNT